MPRLALASALKRPPYLLRRLGGLMFGVDAAGASRHRAFRIGVPARFPAGRPAAPHGGKAAMAESHALWGFPILLEWESRMEEGWRPEIPPRRGFHLAEIFFGNAQPEALHP